MLTSFLGPAPDAAQEWPANVASDLVEQALADSIVAPSSAPARGSASLPIGATATVGGCIVLALLALIARRVRRVAATRAPETPTPPAERKETRPTPARPQPVREALVLPPHVLEIIQKSAERRRLAAAAMESPPVHEEQAVDPSGIDIILPGYDPTRRP